jgi:Leucine-rich repeat (LRR) protein
MDQLRTSKILRLLLASGLIFLVFITVVFLAKSHKQLRVKEVLNNIEDPQLKSCIHQYTKTNNIKFAHELDTLECQLKPNSQGETLHIENLTGISQFKNLKYLSLSNGELGSLDELGYLKNLEYLTLKKSEITAVGDLIALSSLRYLDLSNNNISNASVISHLTNLTYLNLSNNKISNTSFLERLVNITELNLQSNAIRSADHLQNFNKLEALNLSDNKINNINALQFCRALKRLDLSYNRIVDLVPLSNLSRLEEVNLNKNKIEDLSPVSNLVPKKLLLEDNLIKIGVDKLFGTINGNALVQNNINLTALIDLDLNRTINCSELDQLRQRLVNYHHIKILRPKTCINTKHLRHRSSKKKFSSLWKRLF